MYLRAEADVLVQIQHELSIVISVNFCFTIDHVKGHQDDTLTYNELSRQAQLNVKADASAAKYLRNGKALSYDEMYSSPTSLYINDETITRDYKHQIRAASRSHISAHIWLNNTTGIITHQTISGGRFMANLFYHFLLLIKDVYANTSFGGYLQLKDCIANKNSILYHLT